MTTVEGRRYRLPDWLGGHEVRVVEPETPGFSEPHVLVAIVGGEYNGMPLALPEDQLEPVGLDMAEPDNGTVVLIERDGYGPLLGWRRDGDRRNPGNAECRWHTTGGIIHTWSGILDAAVSITVLVPRDDDLRERLTAARDDAAEKAHNLTARTVVGVTHAFYRDVMSQVLDPSGFSINGRRPQADDGE